MAYNKNYENEYTFSCSQDGEFVVSKIKNVWIAKQVDKLCYITLDNGEIVKCTPDHKFLLKNGTYKQAIELIQGMGLMPFYRSISSNGYKILHLNKPLKDRKKGTIPEHLYIVKKLNKELNEKYETHHINKDTLNNNPENLICLSPTDHGKMHSEERSISMAIKNHERKEKYPNWAYNQKLSAKRLIKTRVEEFGSANCKSHEFNSNVYKLINKKHWDPSNNKYQYMKDNIRNCGRDTTYFKMKKHYKIILEELKDKNILLDINKFKEIWEEYRIRSNIRLSSIPHFNQKIHERLIEELLINHKVIKVELVELKNPIDVYDLEVENKEGYHNFPLQAGVFVHNCVQSNASIIGWICASHIQDEFIKQGMYSRVIGNVHDSVEMDIYPGELQDALRIVKYHADTIPNNIYDLLNGVKLRFDFECGKSWGRAGEFKKVEFYDNGETYIKFKGGNLYWEEIEEELKKAYQYEIISLTEERDLSINDKNPLPQPTKEIVVEFKLLTKPTIKEFKSKYYVGNGNLDSKNKSFISIMDKN